MRVNTHGFIRFQPCWINTYCTYKTRTTYGKKAFFLPSSHLPLPLPHLLKSILFARPRILVITSDPGAHIHTTGTRGPVTVLKRSWRLNWGNSANSFPSELRIKCTWEEGRRCEDGRDYCYYSSSINTPINYHRQRHFRSFNLSSSQPFSPRFSHLPSLVPYIPSVYTHHNITFSHRSSLVSYPLSLSVYKRIYKRTTACLNRSR